jgi:uncharacterized membrane protein
VSCVSPSLLQGITRSAPRGPLLGAYVVGCATVATATTTVGIVPWVVPEAVQIVLGLLMVFLIPGFSLACAAIPERQSLAERLLASVGLSVAVTTCAAVLLAATPVGLTRESLAVFIGCFTIVLSFVGLYRSRSMTAPRERGGRSWR